MLENVDLDVIQHEMAAIEHLARVSINDDVAINALLLKADPTLVTHGEGFWANVRTEFCKFICDRDPVYKEEIAAFEKRGKKATPVLVGMLTGAIITALDGGILVSALSPFVALLLYTFAKIGKEAFCKSCEAHHSKPPGKSKKRAP